jgi:hypothetical protein
MREWDCTGVITAGELYTVAELRRRLRLGVGTVRQMRRDGVPMHSIGNRQLVLGADVIRWLQGKQPGSSTTDGGASDEQD